MQDVVVPVALFATGGVGIVSQQGLPVHSPHVIGQFLGMAVSAVNGIQILRVRKSFIIRIYVTGKARIAGMDRMCENGSIHEHGYRSSIHGPGQFPVLMTHHTILI